MRQQLSHLTKILRTNQTPWEAKLWTYLRASRFYGLKFKRQVPIDNFIVDFCSQEKKIIIELDGGHHAENRTQDEKKQKHLEEKGYRVLRFWNNEIDNNLEGVLETIRDSI